MLFNKLTLTLLGIVAVAAALPNTNGVVKRGSDVSALNRRQGCTPMGGNGGSNIGGNDGSGMEDFPCEGYE
ncbi:hypothetical protein OG21DRAFT_1513668 [Imleria badia]|nr:hypothetical protein OG21DRAFT_1513668 [Imleria badia]